MECSVQQKGSKLLFVLNDSNEREFNRLKIELGLHIVESISSKQFRINILDFLLRKEGIIETLKKNKIIPHRSFKNFIKTLYSLTEAISIENKTSNNLEQRLKSTDFTRKLRPFQLENVSKLCEKRYGATFSVPGAGKTSEILSTYMLFKHKNPELKLFVVSPKNAFSAWDEEVSECICNPNNINSHVKNSRNINYSSKMVRLQGGKEKIENLLLQNPDTCIITYQQLAYEGIVDVIIDYLCRNNVFCALDESHRIKGIFGSDYNPGVQARAVLTISFFCNYRYIMSGTPMPQSQDDLYNQYKFLNPLNRAHINEVYDKIKSLYVRTNKKDLGIPKFTTEVILVPMSPSQKELYEKVRNVEKRRYMTSSQSNKLRSLKKSVMRMLQLSSNPRIINDPEFYTLVKGQNLNDLIEESSPKFNKVCEIAKTIISKGEKVIIWSGFRQNIQLLLDELIDMNPVEIDGSTGSGTEMDEGSRDYNINKFKNDASCMVMIANPAAASEGISLHIDSNKNLLCKNAIYLDRNFNAAQFIQSVDRIHRLGITWAPKVYILTTQDSMDARVQERLDEKIKALQNLLEDPSLIPYLSVDPTLDEEEFILDEQSDFKLSVADAKSYLDELRRE